MNRRHFLYMTSAAVIGLASPAHADFVDSVRQQLAAQGYSRITVTKTLLGRSQLVAFAKKGRREIIMNPRTGEILRDVWIGSGGSSGPSIGGSEPRDDDSDNSGSGNGGDDDDDNDDTDDDSGSDDDGGDDDEGEDD